MDGIQKSVGIFVLAATNRSDLIDPALLRPGRLIFLNNYSEKKCFKKNILFLVII